MKTAEAGNASGAKDHRSDTPGPAPQRPQNNSLTSKLQVMLQSRRLVVTLSATLLVAFIALDFLQTIGAAREQLNATTHMLAGTLSNATIADAATMLSQVSTKIDAGTSISLLSDDNTVLASTQKSLANLSGGVPSASDYLVQSNQTITGPLYALVGRQHLSSVFAQSILRAIIAISTWVIFLLGFIALKRTTPSAPQLPLTHAFLESLPQAASYWSEGGRCISANKLFEQHLPEAHTALSETSTYAQTLDALTEDKNVKMLDETANGRKSELTCKKHGVMILEEYPVAAGGFIVLLSSPVEDDQISDKLWEAQQQLNTLSQQIDAQKEKSTLIEASEAEFINSLNHELRTPLNHIIGFSELLRHQSYGELGDKRYVDYAEHIKQSGEVLLETLTSLIESAVAPTQPLEQPHRSAQLTEIANTITQRHTKRAALKNIAFRNELSEDAFISVPAKTLTKIINNVLESAFHLTPTCGEISFSTWVAQDGIVLEISDNGSGLSPAQLDFINQNATGAQTEAPRDDYQTGLIIAQRIVAEIGGEIQINSTQNVGTTVAICLPCEVHPLATEAQDAA